MITSKRQPTSKNLNLFSIDRGTEKKYLYKHTFSFAQLRRMHWFLEKKNSMKTTLNLIFTCIQFVSIREAPILCANTNFSSRKNLRCEWGKTICIHRRKWKCRKLTPNADEDVKTLPSVCFWTTVDWFNNAHKINICLYSVRARLHLIWKQT